MKLLDVFKKTKEIIVDSCGIDENEIKLESTIFGDLSIDSIDVVDILYGLETEYDVSLVIGDFEGEARKELDGEPYEIDSVITAKGLEILRKRMPEISPDDLKQGLTIYELINLIQVQSLCNMVITKVKEKESQE